jgi:hypothetical protein
LEQWLRLVSRKPITVTVTDTDANAKSNTNAKSRPLLGFYFD